MLRRQEIREIGVLEARGVVRNPLGAPPLYSQKTNFETAVWTGGTAIWVCFRRETAVWDGETAVWVLLHVGTTFWSLQTAFWVFGCTETAFWMAQTT
ncbi:unnamed protein product, partial [Sphenostylis stenocarpa]